MKHLTNEQAQQVKFAIELAAVAEQAWHMAHVDEDPKECQLCKSLSAALAILTGGGK